MKIESSPRWPFIRTATTQNTWLRSQRTHSAPLKKMIVVAAEKQHQDEIICVRVHDCAGVYLSQRRRREVVARARGGARRIEQQRVHEVARGAVGETERA